ncbi:GDP-mannose-dependent alpha-(1-6)-phosphatidylinositol monomannoside mannosyltransferase [Rosistilla oblonga]|nr:GDP-mannose-dependent alpha-(1-6)-phosphatidylinositol monomannoside mannosyltransferase [Rosistilla oblonga]
MPELLLSEIFPPRPGGSGRWLYEVYTRLDHPAVALTNGGELPGTTREIVGNLTIIRQPFGLSETGFFSARGMSQYLRLLRRVRAIDRESPVDLARAARVVPEGWVLWLWKRFFGGPSYHVFAHGEEINLDGIENGGVMSSRQHRWMANLCFASAELVIANSENTARLLTDQWGVPRRRVTVAYPGVDALTFTPSSPGASVPARPYLASWSNRFVLLTVGRLQRRKGHDNVIRSLPVLRNQIPDLLYVIAGSGEEETYLRRLADELNVTSLVEFRTNVSDEELTSFYQYCDLFVLANRQVGSDVEGFGMVLLEAAACGKPTIAGRSGGTSEAIADGETGFLVDGNDPAAVADTILKLHNDPALRAELGKAGRIRVERFFAWPIVAKSIPLPDSRKLINSMADSKT